MISQLGTTLGEFCIELTAPRVYIDWWTSMVRCGTEGFNVRFVFRLLFVSYAHFNFYPRQRWAGTPVSICIIEIGSALTDAIFQSLGSEREQQA